MRDRESAARARTLAVVASSLLATIAAVAPARAELGSATLAIAGAHLTVAPESQTVPFQTPTIVETHLQGFDPGGGALPPTVRVVAELRGPGLGEPLRLETVPNEPFRIPRLSLEGEYALDDIRLVDGDDILAFAQPRTALVRVTQILVTRVSSRPMTLEEIRARGIVIDDSSFRAYEFSFGFGVEGEIYDYNVGVIYHYPDADHPSLGAMFTPAASPRFKPPGLAPFTLHLAPPAGGGGRGCTDPGGCVAESVPPLPGVIFFPTDLSLLHQFFSVVLMATNGAPEGDALVIRDLTARIRLPAGLRQARTEPPTVLGAPVPVRHPGPDGVLGTADDLTFLVGQATGQAEFLVEGLREGTHIVDFDLEGILEGMPTGIRRLTGSARGAVVVRDPTLGITVTHPDAVLADEEYDLLLTVANTGITPANLIRVSLPSSRLSGCEVVGANSRTIDSILPGESGVVAFRIRPLLTGRVVASAVRASNHVDPTFELTMGVGEAGIPLSPTSIVLPRESEILPELVRRHALGLVGLGFSLSNAPPELLQGRPQVSRQTVDLRVYELAQAGRYLALGEEPFDALATLAAEWLGGREPDWDWDELRRITNRGALLGDALGRAFADEAAAAGAEPMLARWAETTWDFPGMLAILAEGGDATLHLESRTSGKRLYGPGLAADRLRELPYGDLYDLDPGELALVGVAEPGGYRATIRRRTSGLADVSVVIPGVGGARERLTFPQFELEPAGRAVLEVTPDGGLAELRVDREGDGFFEGVFGPASHPVAPRPFEAVAAVQNTVAEKTSHVVDVLFSRDVDLAALLPADPQRFELPDKLSNGGAPVGGVGVFQDFRSTRIVRVVFDNPLSPYVPHELAVRDVASATGEVLAEQSLPVGITIATPGTLVEGRVIGADGEPIPFARVELLEVDYSNVPNLEDPCVKHVTAAVRTDAQGRFGFDYVRQTECGGVFQLRATEPASGNQGRATGRVRFIGQTVHLDVVMLGRGGVRGRVLYDDGTVPADLRVVVSSPLFQEGRLARINPGGHYEVADVPVGPVQISASDNRGSFAAASAEIAGPGDVAERDLVLLRHPDQPTGDLRGRVLAPDGASPVPAAWVALYVGGRFVDARRSGGDGAYDFGTVPAGVAEIEAFDGQTGRAGALVRFTLVPDRVNVVDVLLRDERGTLEGHVYRRSVGSTTPLAGAVVYVSGQPFNTVTDADGYYRLDGVLAATTVVIAADLERQVQASAPVTMIGEDFHVVRDVYFDEAVTGGVAGEVLGFDGAPRPGVLVHLQLAGSGSWSQAAVTDGAGRFLFEQLPAGTHRVHALDGAVGAVRSATIQAPGQTPFVSVRFERGGITGRTLAEQSEGDPIGVVSVVRYRTTVVQDGLVQLDRNAHDLETDADGEFAIADVLAGTYTLEVFNAFYGNRAIAGTIVDHGQVDDHEILYRLAGTIEGTVLAEDGVTPVAGATVRLLHPAIADWTVQSDAGGRFRFEEVQPHEHCCRLQVHSEEGPRYRDAQVGVVLSQHGQSLDVEVVLPVQGTVSGRVEQADGTPVTGVVVRLAGAAYPYQRLQVQTDANGEFAFSNVLEGPVALTAVDLQGLGGQAATAIAVEGEQRTVLIRLEPIGAVEGVVRSPLDGSAVPNAQVQLRRGGGLFDAVTADGEGRFLFVAVPLASYALHAFDAASGRSGLEQPVPVTYEGERVLRDVVLEARGSVVGHLLEPDGVPVPGAAVELSSSGIVRLRIVVTTGADGGFQFVGIPAGTFRLAGSEPGGLRRAAADGEIVEEGQTVAVDLVLEGLGTVLGTVLAPGAGSIPWGQPASVTLRQDERIVGASADNPFAIDGVIAGRGFRLDAAENGGPHHGRTTGVLTAHGGQVTADVRIVAIGGVRVEVRDSYGNPVPGASVDLWSGSLYAAWGYLPGRRFGTTDAAGTALFPEVGAGPVSAYAVDPVTQLRGAAAGELTVEGEQRMLAVGLEPSARFVGRVLRADGQTPAALASAGIRVGGRAFFLTAGEDGTFDFPAVPVGAWTLDLYESGGFGQLHRQGAAPEPGDLVDLGDLVLDDADPHVDSIAPAEGSNAVPLGAAVVVAFSEPIDVARFQSGQVVLRRLGGSALAVARAWSADARTLTLTPTQPLTSFTSYQVQVATGIPDLAGRTLSDPVQATFTTLDSVPPQVISTVPGQGARNVETGIQLRLLFSEPVDETSLSGAALQLTDLDAGLGVTTTFTLQPQGRELLVTPAGDLAPDHVHELVVEGVRDLSGNTQSAPFTLAFETLDVTAPAIGALQPPAGTSVTAGDPLTVSAEVVDNQGMGTVTFSFLGRSATRSAPDVGDTWSWTLTVPPVAEPGDHGVTITATDAAGNGATATLALHVEPLLDPDAPTIAILCPSAGALLAPGTSLTVAAEAADDQGLLAVEFFLGDDPTPVATLNQPPFVFELEAPLDAQEGDLLELRAVATDYGLKSTEDQVTVAIVTGNVVTGSRTLLAGDDSFEHESVVVVAPATLTIDGAHVFRDLVVLDGARVDHRTTTPSAEYRLELELERDLYVACGGAVDASGLGYRGGERTGGRAWGFGNTQQEGASFGTGAAHGGRGGLYDGSSRTYGSVYDPAEPGGGAGGSSAQAGSAGGGVVRIAAAGRAVVDGAVRANGAANLAPGAAGGSVRLAAAELAGAGTVEASGGPGGGGGRVALHGGTIDDRLAGRTRARGGERTGSGIGPRHQGSAGTVLLRREGELHGELVLDNGGLGSDQWTELIPVGAGIVDAAAADSVTDDDAAFRWSVVGAELFFDGDDTDSWPVTGHQHLGPTLGLEVAGHPHPAGPGTEYAGLWRFDAITVRGAAKAFLADRVASATPAAVEAGAVWLPEHAPPRLRVEDLTVVESTGRDVWARATVALSAPAAEPVQLELAAADGTALAGLDYQLPETTFTIAEGESGLAVDVVVLGDGDLEGTEAFTLSVVSLLGAELERGTATVTILDDETTCLGPNLVANPGNEEPLGPGGPAGWTLETGGPWTRATSPAPDEGSYYFFAGGQPQDAAIAQVVDLSPFASFVDGGGSSFLFEGSVRSYTTDYPELEIELLDGGGALLGSWTSGEVASPSAWRRLGVPVAAPAGTRAARIRMTSHWGQGTNSDGWFDAISLRPIALPTLVATSVSTPEGDAGGVAVDVPVTLWCAPAAPVDVSFASADGTALAGADYLATSGVVQLSEATPSALVPVTVLGDVVDELDESFAVAFAATGPALVAPVAAVTIADDDQAVLAVDDVAVEEGTGTGNLAHVRIHSTHAADREIEVRTATSVGTAGQGSDYVGRNEIVAIPPGATEVDFAVQLVGDAVDELDEEFTVRLSSPVVATIGDDVATVTILDDDDNLLSIDDRIEWEGTGATVESLTFTIQLATMPIEPATVEYATVDETAVAGEDYLPISGVLDFPAGTRIRTLTVELVPDGQPEANETFRLVLSNPVGATFGDAEGIGTIRNDDAYVSVADGSLVEGNSGTSSMVFAVSLSIAARNAADVDWVAEEVTPPDATTATAGIDFAAASGTVSFLTGQSTKSFTVSIFGDLDDEPSERFRVRLTGAQGAVIDQSEGTGTIVDDERPTILSLTPVPGSSVPGNQPFTVAVDATDAAGIDTVWLQAFGQSSPDSEAPYEWEVMAPDVTQVQSEILRVTVYDTVGNFREQSSTIQIVPADSEPPEMTTCPSDGAVALSGGTVRVAVEAADNFGVDRVEVYLGADPDPVAVDSSEPYELDVALPGGLAAGATVELRAVAFDTAGNAAEEIRSIGIVEGTVVTVDTTIGTGDPALDGLDVVVASGATLSFEGPHALASLVVLDGARLTHPPTDATAVRALDLALDGDLYVACAGTIDAAARGYLGGAVGGRGWTYPNQPAGAYPDGGGSHGGQGANYLAGPVYGNLFDPDTPGGGGGPSATAAGSPGGGVVRIAALGEVRVDGAVDATGGSGPANSGAGGSIALSGDSVAGAGTLRARGGDSTGPRAGGGGRIALYGATIDEGFLARADAGGGVRTPLSSFFHGATGTLFAKRDAEPSGALILDGHGRPASGYWTKLLAVHGGFLEAADATSIVDDQASFPWELAGATVQVEEDPARRWPVTGNELYGTALELDVSGLPLDAAAGEFYRGLWSFDRVVVRGGAIVWSEDWVASAAPIEVEPGSSFTNGNEAGPVVDPTRITLGAGYLGLELAGAPGALADPDGLGVLEVINPRTGEVGTIQPAADGSFAAAVAAASGDLLELRAWDARALALPSPRVVVGPVPAGIPEPVVLELDADPVYFWVRGIDADGDRLAAAGTRTTCPAPDPCTEDIVLLLIDLSVPETPTLVSQTVLVPNDSAFGPLPVDLAGDRVGVVSSYGVHVADVTDPAAPVYDAATHTLDLAAGSGSTRWARWLGTELFALVEDGSTGALDAVVVDTSSFGTPTVEATIPLGLVWLDGAELELGRLWVAGGNGDESRSRVELRDLSDPLSPGVLYSREWIRGPIWPSFHAAMRVVAGYEDVVVLSELWDTGESRELRDHTLHRAQPGSEPVHDFGVCSAWGLTCWPLGLIEIGDRRVGSYADSYGPDFTFGVLDSSLSSHGFSVDRVLASASVGSIDGLAVGAGYLWVLDGSNRLVGFRSSLLHPWLDERLVTFEPTASGVRAVGAAGAAELPSGAVVSAVLQVEGDEIAAAVAGDGSFTVELDGVAPGTPVRLFLRTDGGQSGNRVRRRAP